ncbi:MAG: DegV family protein [Chloroflexi bacterium]|nr:DegV family protein [Chloroflexota bacterium]MBI3732178.1 DegV family protein [Chloroflexota bacterium]
MGQVQIVTDSTADLPEDVTKRLGIQVVPLTVTFGSEVLRDGIDIDARQFFKRLKTAKTAPTTSPPSPKAFEEIYGQLVRQHDEILSIHLSSKLSQTVYAAERGALPFLGRKKIAVLDSLSASCGLGYLAVAAAEAAQDGMALGDLVKFMRMQIPHVYLTFFVETLEYLHRGGRLVRAQALLGSMLNIKPLLALEDGEIVPLEKVRTRQRALEKLCEFTLEFAGVRQMTILHSDNYNEVHELAERIKEQLPGVPIDFAHYGPVLASHVGPDAIGIVVFEAA